MEAASQSNQMDVDKEEERPNLDMASLPQERHSWRISEFSPITQGLYPQNLMWTSKRELIQGGNKLLLTHQELSALREDHGALRRMEPIVLQRQGQKDKELVEEPKSFIHRPEEGVLNNSNLGERRPRAIYQLPTSTKNVQRQAQGTSEEA
ncbi:hypothetical protein O181_100483 [Austropuccinia psidii MF-1]|uniref:Uncharacterized protein n=1 Tax=Austropuccinia psidii MF-1 TaxID=1389203 RepID=A0A9Q3JCT4_9BASI|nr:hypothetical protein [Austropuccinia psidii MF-1]